MTFVKLMQSSYGGGAGSNLSRAHLHAQSVQTESNQFAMEILGSCISSKNAEVCGFGAGKISEVELVFFYI